MNSLSDGQFWVKNLRLRTLQFLLWSNLLATAITENEGVSHTDRQAENPKAGVLSPYRGIAVVWNKNLTVCLSQWGNGNKNYWNTSAPSSPLQNKHRSNFVRLSSWSASTWPASWFLSSYPRVVAPWSSVAYVDVDVAVVLQSCAIPARCCSLVSSSPHRYHHRHPPAANSTATAWDS